MKLSRFSMFRLPNSYKKFDYSPRYYDPEQEERDKRRKMLNANQAFAEELGTGKTISFRNGMSRAAGYKAQAKRSNMRLFLILGALLLVFYYLFSEYFVTEGTQQILNK